MITVSDKIQFIQSVFGRGKLHTKNIDVTCPIPNCGKKRLSIRLDDDLNHCWVCGWSASTLLPLLLKYGTREKVDEYRTRFLPENPKYQAQQRCRILHINGEEPKDVPVAKLPSDFRLLAMCSRVRDPDVKATLKYVQSRGLTERELWHWRMGVSDQGNLVRRVIVPSFDDMGELNYFVARAIDKVDYMKYVNCEVDKVGIIYNELNIDWTQPLTLVEGPFDLMKVRGNASCLLGSELSERSLLFNKILYHGTPIILLLDSDMKNKVQKIAKKLSEYNINVSIASSGDKKDPGEMTFQETSEAIKNAKPWTWHSYLLQRVSTLGRCSLRT